MIFFQLHEFFQFVTICFCKFKNISNTWTILEFEEFFQIVWTFFEFMNISWVHEFFRNLLIFLWIHELVLTSWKFILTCPDFLYGLWSIPVNWSIGQPLHFSSDRATSHCWARPGKHARECLFTRRRNKHLGGALEDVT